MFTPDVLEQSQSGLNRRLNRAIEAEHLAHRTQQCYVHWICRFMLFHEFPTPETLEASHAERFFLDLSERLALSRAKLNQAERALTFFYEQVLGKPLQPWSASA